MPTPRRARTEAQVAEAEAVAARGDARGAGERFQAAIAGFGRDVPFDLGQRALMGLGQSLRGIGAYDELERALELARARFLDLARPDLEAGSLMQRSRLEQSRGREVLSLRAARQAARLANRSRKGAVRAAAYLYLGESLFCFRRYVSAKRALRRSLALYRRSTRPGEDYRPKLVLGALKNAEGDPGAARRFALAGLAGAERAGDRASATAGYAVLAYVAGLTGDARSGWRYAACAVRLARAGGADQSSVLNLQALACFAAEKGHVVWSERLARRALEVAGRIGRDPLRATALFSLAVALGAAGRIAEARALLAESIAMHRRAHFEYSAANSLLLEATLAYRAGELERARRAADEARVTLLGLGHASLFADGTVLLAEVLDRGGAAELAASELAGARRALATGRGFTRTEGILALALARRHRRHGRPGPAARALLRAQKRIAATGHVEDRVELGIARAAAAPPGRAPALLDRLDAAARRAGLPWSRVRVLLARGEALRAEGRPADAAAAIEEARAVSERHGFRLCESDALEALAGLAGRAARAGRLRSRAAAIRAECLAGFAASGAPAPPAPAPRDPGPPAAPAGGRVAASIAALADEHGLSEAERQVLETLALGLPNVEIAKRLFISPKTTQWHLKHIYRKLGVRSRVQAVVAIHARP